MKAGLALLISLMAAHPLTSLGSGPCDPPPFDPLVEVASADEALAMDRWARKALRRDLKGKTCSEVQEVVDILVIRWLQAHPEIHVDLNGTETQWLMQNEGAFLLRIKAEAWAACIERRRFFRPKWARKSDSHGSALQRRNFVESTGSKWGGGKK